MEELEKAKIYRLPLLYILAYFLHNIFPFLYRLPTLTVKVVQFKRNTHLRTVKNEELLFGCHVPQDDVKGNKVFFCLYCGDVNTI